MINVRLKFQKGEEVKYISHLDLMRTFQRAIRRADVPIAYSGGFNPHQEISFGAPLSLGVTSQAEYVDIKLSSPLDIADIADKMNNILPKGIKILGGEILDEKEKNAMSIVTHARYCIRLIIEGINIKELNEKIEAFMELYEIKIMKEQPKKDFALKEIDIRPMIVSLKAIESENDEYFLNCTLMSGSKANLKPELMMEAFANFTCYKIFGIKINREETYAENNGRLMDLLEYARTKSKM